MRLDNEHINDLFNMCRRMKLLALDMTKEAGPKGAHIGGGFSAMEIMAVLYGDVLRVNPNDPLKDDRDRFLISKNHCTLAHFPALVEKGFITKEDALMFAKDGSKTIGYPYNPSIGLEYSGGSLGMAISVAIGQALACRNKGYKNHIYCLMGDGELNEGSVWEAFMSAAQFKLSNLTAIIDNNKLCYDGRTDDVMSLLDLKMKLESFGWKTIECNGHSIKELLDAFSQNSIDRPIAIIANTVKSHGLSFAENRPEWHQHALTEEQYELAKKEIMEECLNECE